MPKSFNFFKFKLIVSIISIILGTIYFTLISIFILSRIPNNDETLIATFIFYIYIGVQIFLLLPSIIYIAYGLIGLKQMENEYQHLRFEADIYLLGFLIVSPYYTLMFYCSKKWHDSLLYFRYRRREYINQRKN